MSLPESFRACCLPRIKVQGSPGIIKDPPPSMALPSCPTVQPYTYEELLSVLASLALPSLEVKHRAPSYLHTCTPPGFPSRGMLTSISMMPSHPLKAVVAVVQ